MNFYITLVDEVWDEGDSFENKTSVSRIMNESRKNESNKQRKLQSKTNKVTTNKAKKSEILKKEIIEDKRKKTAIRNDLLNVSEDRKNDKNSAKKSNNINIIKEEYEKDDMEVEITILDKSDPGTLEKIISGSSNCRTKPHHNEKIYSKLVIIEEPFLVLYRTLFNPCVKIHDEWTNRDAQELLTRF